MSKRRKFMIYLVLLVIVCIALVINNIFEVKDDKKMFNIILVANDKHNEDTMLIKKGAEQAAGEYDVNLKIICLSKKNDVQEQLKALTFENNEEVDGFIIEPADYKQIGYELKKLISKKAVVMLIDNTEPKCGNIVSNDNYGMGQMLAENIIKRNKSRDKITIINNLILSTSCKERIKGFVDTMKKSKKQISFHELNSDNSDKYYDDCRNFLLYNKSDIVVTFNKDILQALAEAKKDINNKYYLGKNSERIYGAGSSKKIISLMEDKYIDGIATENKFELGYISVRSAVQIINKKNKKEYFVKSKIINSDNMYSEENQRVLFEF